MNDNTTYTNSESGQTLPLLVVFLVVLLGMCALAIDVGSWYQTKRAMQASADASALAGASQIPQGWGPAQTAATAEWANNGQSGSTVTYAPATDLTSGDSIVVTATRTSSSFFASVLGHGPVTITVHAQATVESFTTFKSTGNLMPWAVMKNDFVPGQSYQIATKTPNNANNGLISLPVEPGCSTANGANVYRDTVSGNDVACDVSLGQQLPTQTGDDTGPTLQGLSSRVSVWLPVSSIVTIDSQGNATVINSLSPQLVVVPLVTDLSGGTTWPNGQSAQVKVVGFAWFVLTPPTNGGKTVNGVFVTASTSGDSGTTGAWTPGTNHISAVALTQ
jgi:Flp pilus assembly protein TadG